MISLLRKMKRNADGGSRRGGASSPAPVIHAAAGAGEKSLRNIAHMGASKTVVRLAYIDACQLTGQ
jgi:hypothetical protein